MGLILIYFCVLLIIFVMLYITKKEEEKNIDKTNKRKFILFNMGKIKFSLILFVFFSMVISLTIHFFSCIKENNILKNISTPLAIYMYISTFLPIFKIIYIEKICKLNVEEYYTLKYSSLLSFINKKRASKEVIQKYLEKKDSHLLRVQLGNIFQKEGGLRRAIEEYIKAVKIKHNDYQTMMKIIRLLKELDRENDAIEILLELIDITDDFYEAYIELAQLLENKNQYKEAIKVYEQALNVFSTIEIKQKLVRLHIRQNNFVEAKELVDQILLEDETLNEYKLKSAQLELIMKDLDSAKNHLNNLLDDKNLKVLAYFELAKIELFSENEKEAIDYLNKALTFYPKLMILIEKNGIFNNIIPELIVSLNVENEIILENDILEDFEILSNITSLVQNIEHNTKIENIKSKVDMIQKKADQNIDEKVKKEIEEDIQNFVKEHFE